MVTRYAHVVLFMLSVLAIFAYFIGVPRLDSSSGKTSRISTEHLDITTYVRDGADASFSLVLDIDPRAGIRVYAPGAAEYHGIAVTAAPEPFLRLRPPMFSTPERLHVPWTNDDVAIYRMPFRVTQDVSLTSSPEQIRGSLGDGDVIVRAVLDYQACTDKVCFPPASVPVSWNVPLRP